MQTLLDCTVWTLLMAAIAVLFAHAGTTDADFIARLRAMRARLVRNLRAWQRRAGR